GAGEPPEQSHAFGYDANLTLYIDCVHGKIEAKDFDAPRRGGEEAGEHLDGGGFSGAIGSEKPEKLARGDAQIHVVHGCKRAETAGQNPPGTTRGVHVVFSSSL